ncbi:MAG: Primosomal protein 1 [Pseudomonadota bacterium]|jgi:integrase
MHRIAAPWCTSVTQLLREPARVLAGARDGAVALLEGDAPAYYLVSAQAWQQRLAAPHTDLDPAQPTAPAPVPNVPTAEAPPLPQAPGAPVVALSGGLTVQALSERLLEREQARVQRGDLCAASLGILRNRLRAHVLPQLGHLPLVAVDAGQLDALLQRLTQAGLSSTTVSQYFVIVRKLLRLAQRLGLIREMPLAPEIRIQSQPRQMLGLAEYARLVRTAQRLCRQGERSPEHKSGKGQRERFWVLPRHRQLPPDMAWAIRFMVNSFIRPGDLRQLRHEHVQVVRGESLYLRLNLPLTKRHSMPVVTLRPAVQVYEALQARAQAKGRAAPQDYLFLPEEKDREYALAVLGFWFKWVLREAGLPEVDTFGRPRTLYALRHTAIMFRLLYGQGIDMLTLARNARTSVQMIERFYASQLDGEMNVQMLQSRRARRP